MTCSTPIVPEMPAKAGRCFLRPKLSFRSTLVRPQPVRSTSSPEDLAQLEPQQRDEYETNLRPFMPALRLASFSSYDHDDCTVVSKSDDEEGSVVEMVPSLDSCPSTPQPSRRSMTMLLSPPPVPRSISPVAYLRFDPAKASQLFLPNDF